jgi:hypothetical protein
MNALEHEVDELRELVDGQEPWSHRRRLHTLEGDKRAAELVRQALDELAQAQRARAAATRTLHRNTLALIPQWGSFLVAAVAIVLAIVLR